MTDKDVTVDTWVELYVGLRDQMRALEAEYDEKKRPYREKRDKVEGILMAALEATGSEAIRTAHGTCHTTTRTSASIADGEAFKSYVIESERYELLDLKANATACKDFVKENGSLPPGVNLTTMTKVGVRRA